jgi:proton glutamate symport protein
MRVLCKMNARRDPNHVSFTLRVAIGLVAGLLLGVAVSGSHSPWLMRLLGFLDPIGAVFVNAIRLAVIPLVVSSLIVGIAPSGNARKISRLGGRALAFMLLALLVAAVFAGAVAFPLFARFNVDANLVARLNESVAAHGASQASLPSAAQWFIDLVPANVFKAAADGALLPLIVVSVAFGLALTRVERQRRATVVQFFQGIADAFLVLVEYVVKFAPIGVFALAVPLAARMGAAAAGELAYYVAILSAVSTAFIVMILYPAAVLFGRVSLSRFAKAAAPAQAVAFTSRSSLAALPAVYEGARVGLGLPEDIYKFFLPLAASMFRVGGAMAQIVGVLFLAKLYGVVLNPVQLATITLTVVVTSLTAPGVPGGGIIVMAPVLTSANIPAAGIGVLLAVDTIPDMFRTTANVTAWLCVGSMLSRGMAATPKPEPQTAAVTNA